MTTATPTEVPATDERERRRRRALGLIRDIRRNLDRVCPQIQAIDRRADTISSIIQKTRDLAEATRGSELLPEGLRADLADAADRFERWRNGLEEAASLCERLYRGLAQAERILLAMPVAPGSRPGVLRRYWRQATAAVVVAAIAAGGIVAAGALEDDDGEPPIGPDETPTLTATVPGGGTTTPPAGETRVTEPAGPDLIAAMEVTSPRVERGNRVAIVPVSVTITNRGNEDAGPFAVVLWERMPTGALRAVPFAATNVQESAPTVNGLAAGKSVTLTGVARIPDESTDFGPATLVAEADSCFEKGPPCNVAELDERNNFSAEAKTGRAIG